MTVRVRIYAEVHPTESKSRVLRAISNIFDVQLASVKKEEKLGETLRLIFEGGRGLLNKFKVKIRMRRLQDLVRNLLLRNRVRSSTYLLINKQAAYMGQLALCDSPMESPLGPITLEIEGDEENEIESVIYWLSA